MITYIVDGSSVTHIISHKIPVNIYDNLYISTQSVLVLTLVASQS